MRFPVAAITAALLSLPAAALDREAVAEAAAGLNGDRRVALEYLRTGNLDMAAVALERLGERWRARRGRLALASDDSLLQAFAAVDAGVAAASAAMDRGDAPLARATLAEITGGLDRWRFAHGVRLFSDCIAEASRAFGALDVTWRQMEAGAPLGPDLARRAETADRALVACAAEAPEALTQDPEFGRLVDGMAGSLRLVSDAVARGDRDYLHRLIIEQRSFDRLLAFRFG